VELLLLMEMVMGIGRAQEVGWLEVWVREYVLEPSREVLVLVD